MKNRFLLFLALLGFMFNATGETVDVEFGTLGNCSICQFRIEQAVINLPGVSSVSWKIQSKVTFVSYDSDTTDLYVIMHAIANVGHDNEWFRAPDSAYNLLLGSCCAYERTNNYEHVQVGYLSMMNQWFYPLGQLEKTGGLSLSVFPNPSTDRLSVKLTGHRDRDCQATLYSLTGDIVGSACFREESTLDVRHLAAGGYILSVSSDGVLIDRKRIVKR